MHTHTLKWASIAALLLAMIFWPASSEYQIELNLVVSTAAVMVAIQAYHAKNYQWVAGFLGLAVLFNPLLPVFRLSGMLGLAFVVFAIAPFAVSLAAIRTTALLSIPSITGRTPGSRSL